jgi:hypothetical protein
MTTATLLSCNSIWLRESGYKVSTLKPALTNLLPALQRALERGLAAHADESHRNFYEIELADRWAYIYVHDDRRTVYLVACSRGQPCAESAASITPQ